MLGAWKMEKDSFNYNYVCMFDVSSIKEMVLGYDKEWTLDTSRQEMYKEHKDTFTYMLQDFSLDWEPGKAFEYKSKYIDKKDMDIVQPIVNKLLSLYNGVTGRIMYINLPSKKYVPPHKDGGFYLKNVRRFHIPILTNRDVVYIINGEHKNMAEGECWEINNLAHHAVFNNSNEDRVHLVIDILPESVII